MRSDMASKKINGLFFKIIFMLGAALVITHPGHQKKN
jgi:hypothetical protein